MTPQERTCLRQLMLVYADKNLQKGRLATAKGPLRVIDIITNQVLNPESLEFILNMVSHRLFGDKKPNLNNKENLQQFIYLCLSVGLDVLFDNKGNLRKWCADVLLQFEQPIDNQDELLKNAMIDGFIRKLMQDGFKAKFPLVYQKSAPLAKALHQQITGAPNWQKVVAGDEKPDRVRSIKKMQTLLQDKITVNDQDKDAELSASEKQARAPLEVVFEKFERDQAMALKKIKQPGPSDMQDLRTWMFIYVDNYQKFMRFVDSYHAPDINQRTLNKFKQYYINKMEDVDKEYHANYQHFREAYDYYKKEVLPERPQYLRKMVFQYDQLMAIFKRVMRDVASGKTDLDEAAKVIAEIDKFNHKVIESQNPKLKPLMINDTKERRFAGLDPDSLSVRTLLTCHELDRLLSWDDVKKELTTLDALLQDNIDNLRWLLDGDKITDREKFDETEKMINSEFYAVNKKILPKIKKHMESLKKANQQAKDPELRNQVQARLLRGQKLQTEFEKRKMRLDLLRQTCAHHEYHNSTEKPKKQRMQGIEYYDSLDSYNNEVKEQYGQEKSNEEMQQAFLDAAYDLQDINPYCQEYVGSDKPMKNKCGRHVQKEWQPPEMLPIAELGAMTDVPPEKKVNKAKPSNILHDSMQWDVAETNDEQLNRRLGPEVSGYDGVKRKAPRAKVISTEINTAEKQRSMNQQGRPAYHGVKAKASRYRQYQEQHDRLPPGAVRTRGGGVKYVEPPTNDDSTEEEYYE